LGQIKLEDLFFYLRFDAFKRSPKPIQVHGFKSQPSDFRSHREQIAGNHSALGFCRFHSDDAAPGKRIEDDPSFRAIRLDIFPNDVPRFTTPKFMPDVHRSMRLGRDLSIKVMDRVRDW
jgi:hypothetical protein